MQDDEPASRRPTFSIDSAREGQTERARALRAPHFRVSSAERGAKGAERVRGER